MVVVMMGSVGVILRRVCVMVGIVEYDLRGVACQCERERV